MVEYGRGVSEGAGTFSGSQGGGRSGTLDAGDNVVDMLGGFVGDASSTISTMPPIVVALGAACLIVVALMVLRRAL
jgi:hypothetical protein